MDIEEEIQKIKKRLDFIESLMIPEARLEAKAQAECEHVFIAAP